jgi:hypothetical protein
VQRRHLNHVESSDRDDSRFSTAVANRRQRVAMAGLQPTFNFDLGHVSLSAMGFPHAHSSVEEGWSPPIECFELVYLFDDGRVQPADGESRHKG